MSQESTLEDYEAALYSAGIKAANVVEEFLKKDSYSSNDLRNINVALQLLAAIQQAPQPHKN